VGIHRQRAGARRWREPVEIGDKPASRPKVKHYERKFWTIDEAIAYANGDDGGDIALDTIPVQVRGVY
jgi:hypothetical protein